MPTQEEVFESIVSSARAGARSVDLELAESATAALKDRYFDWIVKPGKDKDGKETKTPQEVWDTSDGDLLRGKFEEIGRRAAETASTTTKTAERTNIDEAAKRVEAASMCDWCRQVY